MATVSTKSIVDAIIEGNGIYPGDERFPPVVKIVEYQNQYNGESLWGLVYKNEPNQNRYEFSPNCRNAHVIWLREVS